MLADLDASTGAILDALEQLGLAGRTLVLVTSDNGPWFQGSRGPLRGRKGGSFEGGMRVPCLARWPGSIPAGSRSSAVAAGVDLFPTLLGLAGVPHRTGGVQAALDYLAEAAAADRRNTRSVPMPA